MTEKAFYWDVKVLRRKSYRYGGGSSKKPIQWKMGVNPLILAELNGVPLPN